LRTRNSTTEIFRNEVVVTTTNTSNPNPKVIAISARMPGCISAMVEQANEAHTQAVADTHDLAAADAASVGHDVDRIVRRSSECKHVTRRYRAQLLELDGLPAQLECQLNFKIAEIIGLDDARCAFGLHRIGLLNEIDALERGSNARPVFFQARDRPVSTSKRDNDLAALEWKFVRYQHVAMVQVLQHAQGEPDGACAEDRNDRCECFPERQPCRRRMLQEPCETFQRAAVEFERKFEGNAIQPAVED
jgi:hypothetical protein